MSSSASRSHHHRRRSHSASSSGHITSPRYPSNATWRTTQKRARPSTLYSPSYRDLAYSNPPEKWDVDMWRRGKRARISSSTAAFTGIPAFLTADSTQTAAFSSSLSSSFASTSAAFQFFPSPPHRSIASSRFSRPSDASSHLPDASVPEAIPTDKVDQLRTDAFWELHRSVAESGEGLVSRMRDWEYSQSGLVPESHRRWASGCQQQPPWMRKRAVSGQSWSLSPNNEDGSDEEDDIQIISEDTPPQELSPSRPPSHKKRAFSLSVMDVDHSAAFNLYITPDSSERCSSPVDTHFPTASQSYFDGDEEAECASSPPALTHTYTNSASSSLISLSLPPPHIVHTSQLSSEHTTGCMSLETSCTEKDIAALSLAMANGAGGLNDYETLRIVESKASSLDESHVGEMWH